MHTREIAAACCLKVCPAGVSIVVLSSIRRGIHWSSMLKGQMARGLLVTSPSSCSNTRCNPLDIDYVSQNVRSYQVLDASKQFIVVCVGCGDCVHEVEVIKALHVTHSLRMSHVLFMDRAVSTNIIPTIQRLQQDCPTLLPAGVCPFLTFSYADLTAQLQTRMRNDPHAHVIVISLNACFEFTTTSDVYDCHAFMCQCAAWAEQPNPILSRAFINYLSPGACGCRAPQTHMHTTPWWDQAVHVITCAAAKSTLLAASGTARCSSPPGTAGHPP